jgi:hypothetical protein
MYIIGHDKVRVHSRPRMNDHQPTLAYYIARFLFLFLLLNLHVENRRAYGDSGFSRTLYQAVVSLSSQKRKIVSSLCHEA